MRRNRWPASGGIRKRDRMSAAEFESRGLERNDFGFYKAVKKGDLAAVELFLSDGFSPNARHGRGEEPILLIPVGANRLDVFRALVDAGADVRAADRLGWQAIHLAARDANVEILKELLRAGADPNAYGYPETEGGAFVPIDEACVGTSGLRTAETKERIETVRVLLQHGAKVNVYNPHISNGAGPLYQAALRGFNVIVQLLLEHGAEFEVEDNSGTTPLMGASYIGNAKTAEILLSAGAQPNHRSRRGTALLLAVKRGRIDVVRLLLNAGADPKLTNAEGKSAYDFARDPEIIRLLRNRAERNAAIR